jgi:aryl-alcohol dehydrogenase-like predicted oxidoreductase
MEYRTLGRTGVQVSSLCLGTANFGGPTAEADAIRIIHRALDGGINFIDTADAYSQGASERIVGRALANGRRANVVLATKVGVALSDDPNDRGVSRRHILKAVEDSLRRLQTEWIDLYQIHWPIFDTPQDETLRTLDDLVHQGKVRHVGSCSYPAWLVMEALALSERYGLCRYVTEQPPYNLLDRRIENELVPLALRHGLGILPWSPLAMGMLAGRYKQATRLPPDSRAGRIGSWAAERVNDRALAAVERLTEVAQARSLTSGQLALLWVKDQPAVTAPIIGPRTESHLEQALVVLGLRLDAETAALLDGIVPPGCAVADFHNTHGWMKMKLAT